MPAVTITKEQANRRRLLITCSLASAAAWLTSFLTRHTSEPTSAIAALVAMAAFSIPSCYYTIRYYGRWHECFGGARPGVCPVCALRLNNLPPGDPCPSCGTPTPLFPTKPLGHPVCARCHHNMTGREQGRTCPDCGAMYGIEYVEEALAPAP